jgi:hypothetical protein
MSFYSPKSTKVLDGLSDGRLLIDVDLGGLSSSLRELDGVALSWHGLSFRSPRYVWVRVRVGPPPAVDEAALFVIAFNSWDPEGLAADVRRHEASLVDLLRNLPRLTPLTIWVIRYFNFCLFLARSNFALMITVRVIDVI